MGYLYKGDCFYMISLIFFNTPNVCIYTFLILENGYCPIFGMRKKYCKIMLHSQSWVNITVKYSLTCRNNYPYVGSIVDFIQHLCQKQLINIFLDYVKNRALTSGLIIGNNMICQSFKYF